MEKEKRDAQQDKFKRRGKEQRTGLKEVRSESNRKKDKNTAKAKPKFREAKQQDGNINLKRQEGKTKAESREK
ncbi:MAG: hypothetical protein K2J83_01665, partial [Clostridia bacterium]|nr:hypothetical protein [Clostridia bacterium]